MGRSLQRDWDDRDGETSARALELRGIHHEYRSGRRPAVLAIEDVSLAVWPGELVSVIGASGCGKSTLVRIAAGLLEPSSGEVRVVGRPPSVARKERDISIVFQEHALLAWRTTLRNVTLAAEVAGIDKRTRDAKARSLLAQVGLAGFEDFLPAQLSGGMKQRAAVARALMVEPKLLLMDEPFGALDHITRERLQLEFSAAWTGSETGAVLITHDVDEAVFMSDRILVLTSAPARIAGTISIDEGRPRTEKFRTTPTFFDHCCVVRDLLRAATDECLPPTSGP